MGARNSKQVAKVVKQTIPPQVPQEKVNVYKGYLKEVDFETPETQKTEIYTFKEDYDEILRRNANPAIQQQVQEENEKLRQMNKHNQPHPNQAEQVSVNTKEAIKQQIISGKRQFTPNSNAFIQNQESEDQVKDRITKLKEEGEMRPQFRNIMEQMTEQLEEYEDPDQPITGDYVPPPNKREIASEPGENPYHPLKRYPGTFRAKDAEVLFEMLRRLRPHEIQEKNLLIDEFSATNKIDVEIVKKLINFNNTFSIYIRDTKKFGFWNSQKSRPDEKF